MSVTWNNLKRNNWFTAKKMGRTEKRIKTRVQRELCLTRSIFRLSFVLVSQDDICRPLLSSEEEDFALIMINRGKGPLDNSTL